MQTNIDLLLIHLPSFGLSLLLRNLGFKLFWLYFLVDLCLGCLKVLIAGYYLIIQANLVVCLTALLRDAHPIVAFNQNFLACPAFRVTLSRSGRSLRRFCYS